MLHKKNGMQHWIIMGIDIIIFIKNQWESVPEKFKLVILGESGPQGCVSDLLFSISRRGFVNGRKWHSRITYVKCLGCLC